MPTFTPATSLISAPPPAASIIGDHAIFLFRAATADPTSAWTMLRNSSYEIKPKGLIKETPNTTDGMLRTGGLPDYSITVKGSTNPNDAVDTKVKPLYVFDFRAYRSGSYANDGQGNITGLNGAFYAGRAIVEECPISTGATEEETWNLTAHKQSGVLTYPDGTTF